ncbi:unnamed protein product, partial [Mesorhabditis belari]|uniref:ATP synthase F0 subunit 8 n=1 Tax=Mesorhabditis belari TaxID=2138241 RepID=A0AAF3EH63_9BILA
MVLRAIQRFIILYILYTITLVLCVPLSAFIWHIRRNYIKETKVAGDNTFGVKPKNLKESINNNHFSSVEFPVEAKSFKKRSAGSA